MESLGSYEVSCLGELGRENHLLLAQSLQSSSSSSSKSQQLYLPALSDVSCALHLCGLGPNRLIFLGSETPRGQGRAVTVLLGTRLR